ncbi:ubiquitin carboxyl-terminal hydrolase [Musa troglodytarum]|uniref:Ubiquitin carboxyl-terminal hydrolase n=1 Tax=Musa troglodytarum TaxID=320322 RepID=A0A9E7GX69_9LILI|nr:ubiquitin carboxyl-terminal hydrolase [Musa troglodytarum]
MNIFRLAGDMTHLMSVLVLLLKIHTIKSCAGKSQLFFFFFFSGFSWTLSGEQIRDDFGVRAYRAFYIFNWIYRYFTEPHYVHWITWISGLVQTLLYADFFYYYFNRGRRARSRRGPPPEEEEMEASGSAMELSPEEERILIRDITIAAESLAKEGDTFFLISQRWWQHWLDYVNQDMTSSSVSGSSSYGAHHHDSASSSAKRPSAIDNSDLIYDATSKGSNVEIELHDTLVEGRDYILLPQQIWEKLHGWYGGGPTLPRKAINTGLSQTDLAIEVYPLRLRLTLMPKGERAIIRISKKETVGELHKKACEVFDLILDQVCIWDYYGEQKHALMDNMDKTLDDANIQMDQDILVEVFTDGNGTADGGCTIPLQENGYTEKYSTSVIVEPSQSSLSVADGLSTNNYAPRSCSSEFSQSQYLASPSNDLDNLHGTNNINTRTAPLGLTGLLNLGNTCFMNSAIQCLVHTPEFARYFREDYRQEINWQNPLGMVGELALAFGELLRKLWAPGRTPVSPRPFKTKLARFAPQFSGNNQHDSQELLAFLLDGLHEDLNRVKHKPYIKSKDTDGRPDEEVADEYWANHIARNDSIIVDVCQGQYKSTLVCPVCGKVSVTFDPFMYLSLPLQSASTRTMTVMVFTSDGSALPTTCTVNVPKHGRCRDLIQALSNACSLKNGEKLLLAEIRGHMINQLLEDPLILLSTIKDDDRLVAYKILNVVKNTIYLQFVHRREVGPGNINSSVAWEFYGIPLLASISRDEIVTGAAIQEILQRMLAPMLGSEELRPLSMSGSSMNAASQSHQDRANKACLDSHESQLKDQELNCKSESTHKMQLQLVDENNAPVDLSSVENPIMMPGSSIVLFINWSKKDLKKYDTHHFENHPEVFKFVPAPKRTRGEPLSLYACLDAFLREEPLVPEDMWYCPRCKEQRQASKKLDLWRLPEVLVIHLKRFSFSRSTKHKLETFVNFPIHDLDLTNYVAHKKGSQRQIYELYALSNHYGSMASGHYTAHIKLLDENRWYNFDDSHISPINEEDVKSAAAYVLFYRRTKGEDASTSIGAESSANKNHSLSKR